MNLKKLFQNSLLVLGIGLSCYSSHAMKKNELGKAFSELQQLLKGHISTQKELDKGFLELQIRCLQIMATSKKEAAKNIRLIKQNLEFDLHRGKNLALLAQKSVKRAILKISDDKFPDNASNIVGYYQYLSFALKTLACKKNNELDPKRYVSTRPPSPLYCRQIFLYQCREIYPLLMKKPTSDLINTFISLTLFAWDYNGLSSMLGNIACMYLEDTNCSVQNPKGDTKLPDYIDIKTGKKLPAMWVPERIVIVGNEIFTHDDRYLSEFDSKLITPIGKIDNEYFSVKTKNAFPCPYCYAARNELFCAGDGVDRKIQSEIKMFLEENDRKCTEKTEGFEEYCSVY